MRLLMIFTFWILKVCNSQVVSPSIPVSAIQAEASIRAQENPTPCAKACQELASLIPEKISFESITILDYWDAKQSSLQPACRAEPENAGDVSTILKTAVQYQCEFAVKSGGHAREAGFSSVDKGIVIDLTRLRKVEISSDRKSVLIGAGNRWVDVLKTLEPKNLMVLSGRVADVGVGGFTLGGGISYYSNEFGWACDSVISYEIILPDGTIKNKVTHTSDPDLYKALRGAGQANFGVVTSFQFETFETKTKGLWFGTRSYPWDQVKALTKLHMQYFQSSTDRVKYTGGFQAFIYVPDYDMFMMTDFLIHTRHENAETWPEVFAHFKALEAMPDSESTAIRSYSGLTEELEKYQPYGRRNMYSTYTFKPSETLILAILDTYKKAVESAKGNIEEFQFAMTWHLLSRQTIESMQKNGGSAISMNLKAEDAPLLMTNVALSWANESDDQKAKDTLNKYLKKCEASAKEANAWHPYKYVNYIGFSQNPLEGFGEDGLNWLRKVQKEFDPSGVFTRNGLNKGALDLFMQTDFGGKDNKIRDEL